MWVGNFKQAVRSLGRAKARSFFTMLGIIIGISSVVTVVSLGEGLKQQIVGQINHLGRDVITVRSGKLVNGGGNGISSLNLLAFLGASTLTARDAETISQLPSVSAVAPMDFVTSSAKAGGKELDNLFIIGTSPDASEVLPETVEYGNFFNNDSSGQNFAVIGTDVALQLFGEINPVGHSLMISGQNFVVSGVLARSSGSLLSVAETDFNSAILIPLTPAEQLASGQTNILQILVKAKDANNLDATVSDVNSALLKNHQGQQNFTVLKQYELLHIAGGVINQLTAFISGIAAISLLVGGIGIMDIMLVSVSERNREIGIRKAIGATNRQILNHFLVEGLVLSIGGGIFGVVASLIVFAILRIYTNLNPVITVPIMILAVGVSVIV
ncbi:MAG TPA: ABC transporter permease, partial [Candidatus Nitrosopolaris sp.]|nr:ABC transporter permease [Candidatus Nitrosopolaris sp.]